MTVEEFEMKLEAMYGITNVDIEIEYTISGWREANNTMKAFYSIDVIFGVLLFLFSIPIIFVNELKYRRLCNAWYLYKLELHNSEKGETKPENHNKLIFTKGDLTIEKQGGVTHCAKDDTL